MVKPAAKKKPKVITDLVQDEKNINRGTEEGAELIDKSIDEVGFGRSIVVDRDNKIIAGNKTTQSAIRKGKTKIRIVETSGDELIVVKRTDISINSEKGTKLKILDNTTSKKNYVQDAVVSEAIVEEYNLNASQLGLDQIDNGPAGSIRKVPIEPFKKTHVLISFPPAALVHLQPLFEKIQKMDGIEVEQSSN